MSRSKPAPPTARLLAELRADAMRALAYVDQEQRRLDRARRFREAHRFVVAGVKLRDLLDASQPLEPKRFARMARLIADVLGRERRANEASTV
jgi:glutamine synthetase adenylyltransferase